MTDLDQTRGWMREGTARLTAAVDEFDDAAFAAPSALPGWTRAHVVGHLARNAEALHRLATWAATDVETPMYTGPEQRATDIETSATLAPAVLRTQLHDTAADLERALDGLDDRAWNAEVRSALGRAIAATEIPWMRVREVWLHAVDLGTGVRPAGFPDELVDALLADIGPVVGAKPECPPVRVTLTDRGRDLLLGPAADAHVVSGTAADALAWVSGRSDGAGLAGDPPALPRWI